MAKRAGPALDRIPPRGDKDHQLPLEESTHVSGRAVLGEVYIWKRTLIWAGGSLALSGPCSPAWLHGRWAVQSPPYRTWLSPRKREGFVLTQPCAQGHPTLLTSLASMSQPAAMGRKVGCFSKSGGSRGMELLDWANPGNGRRQGRGFGRRMNTCLIPEALETS